MSEKGVARKTRQDVGGLAACMTGSWEDPGQAQLEGEGSPCGVSTHLRHPTQGGWGGVFPDSLLRTLELS